MIGGEISRERKGNDGGASHIMHHEIPCFLLPFTFFPSLFSQQKSSTLVSGRQPSIGQSVNSMRRPLPLFLVGKAIKGY